ncbi:MAG: GIY-YIG nuclease family protein [Planctomycetes bacterium]|nr:GIY-YIG nuclease family protein [Planctomycetota bacterium]
MVPFWVYVLENPTGHFYVGHTDELPRRVAEHNEVDRGQVTYTHKHGPWTLVWSEPHADRASAVRRERQIKRMKSARWIRQYLLNPHSVENDSIHRMRECP